jgi:hypothetical protein
MLTQPFVRFQRFGYKGEHLARSALEMCADEPDELIAWMGINPYAIL